MVEEINWKSKEFLVPFILVISIAVIGIIVDTILNLKGKLVIFMFVEFIVFFGVVIILGLYAKTVNKKLNPKVTRPITILCLILVGLIYFIL